MLIGVERRRAKLDEIVHDEDDVAMAAVTLAELLVGVALADDRHRPKSTEGSPRSDHRGHRPRSKP
jgi:predicted nucleic acid-binding protein